MLLKQTKGPLGTGLRAREIPAATRAAPRHTATAPHRTPTKANGVCGFFNAAQEFKRTN